MTKTKQHDRRALVHGLLALGSALILVLALMVSLGQTRPEPVDQITIPPTLAANPYGPKDFTYQDGYLSCTAGESVLGIDVSEYQLDIDWEQVRGAGVEFVMIRVGYRGYGEGAIHTDANAQAYYDGAKAAGLKVGAYFFSQAITVQEAIAEAEYALNVMRGWELDMPMVYDWEYVSSEARTADMDARTLTDCTLAFCRVVKRGGYEPMVYFNVSQGEHLLYLRELAQYPFWLAMYSDEMDYPHEIEMWQYTAEGTVPGIGTPVDLNLWFPKE